MIIGDTKIKRAKLEYKYQEHDPEFVTLLQVNNECSLHEKVCVKGTITAIKDPIKKTTQNGDLTFTEDFLSDETDSLDDNDEDINSKDVIHPLKHQNKGLSSRLTWRPCGSILHVASAKRFNRSREKNSSFVTIAIIWCWQMTAKRTKMLNLP